MILRTLEKSEIKVPILTKGNLISELTNKNYKLLIWQHSFLRSLLILETFLASKDFFRSKILEDALFLIIIPHFYINFRRTNELTVAFKFTYNSNIHN